MTPRVALTIAGSDSGGGAGIQADLKTFAALGVYGTSAISAVTAQHTAAVLRVVALDPDMVLAQVHAVLADLPPSATKTGMLANPEIVKGVADIAARGLLPNLVVDPVLVSTSGHSLMDTGGVAAYRELLFPHAAVVTPNLQEGALLAGVDVRELVGTEEMLQVAEELRKLGPHMVVLKGGHLHGNAAAADVVVGPGGPVVLERERVGTKNDHGTGCSLSAAICAELALGTPPALAAERAKSYVHEALTGAARWQLGSGHGPIDHFGWGDEPPSRG